MQAVTYGANPFRVLKSMWLSAVMAIGGIVGWATASEPFYRYSAAALGVIGVVIALFSVPVLVRPIRLTLSADGFELIDGSTRSFVAWSDVQSLELFDETFAMVVWWLKREKPATGWIARQEEKKAPDDAIPDRLNVDARDLLDRMQAFHNAYGTPSQ